jgi:hypothetical protein
MFCITMAKPEKNICLVLILLKKSFFYSLFSLEIVPIGPQGLSYEDPIGPKELLDEGTHKSLKAIVWGILRSSRTII